MPCLQPDTRNLRHSRRAFTLIETLLVIAIMSIVFVAMAPAYDAFQVRSQVRNATDRTEQIIKKAKTLAISGFRPANSATAKFFVIDLENGKKTVTLCMQNLDAKTDPQSVNPTPCTPENTIEVAELGQINIHSASAKIAFFPPFGESAIYPAQPELSIVLKQGNSTLPRAQSTLLFTRATGRIEVQ